MVKRNSLAPISFWIRATSPYFFTKTLIKSPKMTYIVSALLNEVDLFRSEALVSGLKKRKEVNTPNIEGKLMLTIFSCIT